MPGELFVHPNLKHPTTLPAADNVCAFGSMPWAEHLQCFLLLTCDVHSCSMLWTMGGW